MSVSRSAVVVSLVTVAAALAAPATATPPTWACNEPAHARGEWTAHGRDAANSRFQPNETGPGAIGPGNVHTIRPEWAFYTGTPSGTTAGWLPHFNGTPIVGGGCVFVGSGDGRVFALDADTGEVVWVTDVSSGTAGLAGWVAASVALTNDSVVVMVNREGDGTVGPFAVGLARDDGKVRWTSESVVTTPGTYTNANPAVYDDILVYGYSAFEGDPTAQGGFALVDTRDGTVLARVPTIPLADQAQGYAGGGIWTAPAIDTQLGFAYIGTGNPYSKKIEHPRTNAILKVDLRRSSPTFGQVLASYKGEPDQAYDVVYEGTRPTCAAIGDDRTLYETARTVTGTIGVDEFDGTVANAQQCGQLNLGFGAGVNLFTVGGQQLVGGLHKSGFYHFVNRATMTGVGRTLVGAPGCEVCNASSPAVDGSRVYAAVMPGPVMRSIDRVTQQAGWASPILDGAHYAAVSAANGVVYTVDGNGFLDAFDAANGVPLARRPLTLDGRTGQSEFGDDAIGLTAAGVAIARGRVYVSAGSQVVAFVPGPLP